MPRKLRSSKVIEENIINNMIKQKDNATSKGKLMSKTNKSKKKSQAISFKKPQKASRGRKPMQKK